jgi:hypothetical protein
VLDFYSQRSPIFLAAVFDGEAAADRGQALGDGTPVHLTIPTDDPWVPLRILGLGKQPTELVEADVFLLTDREPAILPQPNDGLILAHNDRASDLLLEDLRSDAGMEWVPDDMWLAKLQVNSTANDLKFDLAIDVTGANNPSRIDAGLDLVPQAISSLVPENSSNDGGISNTWAWAAGVAAVVAAVFVTRRVSEARK